MLIIVRFSGGGLRYGIERDMEFVAARTFANDVQGYPVKPFPEQRLVPKFGQVSVCPKEDILGNIFGFRVVHTALKGEGEDRAFVEFDQLGEGVLVPGYSSLYQIG